jgi:hypothetical protein
MTGGAGGSPAMGGATTQGGALPGVTGGTPPLALTGEATQSLGVRGGLPDMMSSI